MIYTPLTAKAMRIAYAAHHGQTDSGGVPYIFHAFHVAEQMTDEISACVALLHDVAEDTSVTLDDLESEFPSEVMEALRLLTYRRDTDYFEYVRAIRQNPLAQKVKLADIAHNSDETRLSGCANVSAERRAAWRRKYARAKAILDGTEKDG